MVSLMAGLKIEGSFKMEKSETTAISVIYSVGWLGAENSQSRTNLHVKVIRIVCAILTLNEFMMYMSSGPRILHT